MAETSVTSHAVVLFDGNCGFCDAMVRFIIRHDPAGHFRFAPLESEVGKTLLVRHQLDPAATDSVVLIDGDRAYTKSTAVLLIAVGLAAPWPLLGILGHLPLGLRDQAYAWFARHRRQWFKPPACPLPTDEERERFLESVEGM
jgi:predicted DCC family thiol-disulfide oxidoreductase YuxK